MRTSITIRQPAENVAELVITAQGEVQVWPVSFDQLRLLSVQAAEAISRWPVRRARGVRPLA
jgi:hypothetical protein